MDGNNVMVLDFDDNNLHLHFSFSTLTIDSKKMDKLMFHTPNSKSYKCSDVGKISLLSGLQWNYTNMAPTSLQNTTVSVLQVQFDAFRNVDNGVSGTFRVSKIFVN